jgi:O-antigen/teichoic acid export membrane protein
MNATYVSWLSKIIIGLVQIISVRYLVEYLGPKNYGEFMVIYSFNAWMMLADFGFGTTIQNKFSENRAKYIDQTKLLASLKVIQLALIIIWMPIIIILTSKFSNYIFLDLNTSKEVIINTLIFGNIVWMLTCILGISYKITYCLNKGYLANIYPAIAAILTLLLIAACLENNSYTEYKFYAMIACMGIPPLIAVIFCTIHLPRVSFIECFKFKLKDIRVLIKHSSEFFIFALMVAMVTNLDYIIMSNIFEGEQIAQYNILARIYAFIYFFYYTHLLILWPKFSEKISTRDFNFVRINLKSSILLGIILILFSYVVLVFFKDYVSQLMTKNTIDLEIGSITAFTIYYIIRVIGDAYAVAIASVNRIRIFLFYMPLQILLSGSLQYYLGLEFGITGIVYGMAISFILTSMWINPYFYYKRILVKCTTEEKFS